MVAISDFRVISCCWTSVIYQFLWKYSFSDVLSFTLDISGYSWISDMSIYFNGMSKNGLLKFSGKVGGVSHSNSLLDVVVVQ